MKTKVRITQGDHQYNQYERNETGYIDGYVRGGEDRPYAVVVIERRKCLVLVDIHSLQIIE